MDKNQFFINFSPDKLREIIQECVRDEVKDLMASSSENTPDLIKAKEACELLQVSKVTLHKWHKEGRVTGYYLGTRLFYKKSELLESLSKNSAHGRKK